MHRVSRHAGAAALGAPSWPGLLCTWPRVVPQGACGVSQRFAYSLAAPSAERCHADSPDALASGSCQGYLRAPAAHRRKPGSLDHNRVHQDLHYIFRARHPSYHFHQLHGLNVRDDGSASDVCCGEPSCVPDVER